MEYLKKILESPLTKIFLAILTAIFTVVRFTSLAFPNVANEIAVIGLVVCATILMVLVYEDALKKLLNVKSETEKLSSEFIKVQENLANLVSIIQSNTNLEPQFNSITAKIDEINSNTISLLSSQASLQDISSEALYLALAKKYGYANDLVEIECLLYEDGSARVERKITVSAFAKYDEIDTYLMVPEFLEKDGYNTPIMESEPRIIPDGRTNNVRNITWRPEPKLKGRSTAVLKFFPPLTDGISCTYSFVERTGSNTFILEGSAQELNERARSNDPDEYFGWNINRPTRNLRITIIFPEGYEPDQPTSKVLFATSSGFPSVQLQTEEQNLINEPLLERALGGRQQLYFEAEYPMMNLIYSLRWFPQVKA